MGVGSRPVLEDFLVKRRGRQGFPGEQGVEGGGFACLVFLKAAVSEDLLCLHSGRK